MAAVVGAMAASSVEIEEFINGALVAWLESCLCHPEILCGYDSLLDGHIIHNVWLQIDPEPSTNPRDINDLSGVPLAMARVKNFECIVRNMKQLFEEEFGQTILLLPDCYTLGYHPETKQGLEQMKILLTLLLGAAVQCPNKEHFIGRIKGLDVDTQHSIVELIKQVTVNHSLVLSEESIELLSAQDMYNHIVRLSRERDNIYLKWISAICAETVLNQSTCSETLPSLSLSNGVSSPVASPSSNDKNNHMAVELADSKSRLRKLRQELEEKSESYLELREEFDHKNAQYEKLRLESQEWHAEAKRATAYRDELDVLRERSERADKLEVEVQKLRDKLTDSDFYKIRVEELREDNRMLLETKEMLEEQLQRSRKRSEHVMTLESEIIKYKQKLNDLTLERDADRSRMEELIEENTQFQLAAKNLTSTIDMDKSFSDIDDGCNSGDNSLSEQLTNSAQTRVLKLELENRRLAAALDQVKESAFHESTNKILELEKDKKRLSLKVEQMQDNIQRLIQQNNELENLFKNALKENKKIQDTLDQRQKAHDKESQERETERNIIIDLEKHIETLTKEKQRIQRLHESIQRRADDLERTLETRGKEIERYTAKVKSYEETKELVYELQGKITGYERENSSLSREVNKLKENLEGKSVVLDQKCAEISKHVKEINRLVKAVEDNELAHARITELETKNHDLLSQHEIDLQTISTLRNDLVNGTLATNKVRHRLEKLGLNVDPIADDNSDLNVETVVEKLVRNPETFKTVREIMLNVSKQQQISGNAKSDICVLCHRKEVFTVEKNIELSSLSPNREPRAVSFEHTVRLGPSQETVELIRLSEANTQLSARYATLQSINEELQAENARFKVDVATLGSQVTSLNTQHVALQLTNSQLSTDKDTLLKKNESLKQEHKNLLHDQVTLQCLHDQLSAEYESLNTEKEQLKAVARDSRNESRELRGQIVKLESQVNDMNRQQSSMTSCVKDLTNLRAEHSKLTDDFRNLFANSSRYKNEFKNIQEQYKQIREENNKLKLQNTEMSDELTGRVDQIKILERQYSQSTQRCEMLVQQNRDLDYERKTLMENVSHLLKQYHELLSLSLEDKKHFHEEEKSYTECVHNLTRQKEKLEEKIMELFKKSESAVPKKKPFASSLVRRVKKASSDFMSKVPSRNRRTWIDDTRSPQSGFMVGSESGGNDSDNSTEEPISISSDTHLLQRNIPIRQSLQRNTLDNSISRGGTLRSSLQTQRLTDLGNSRRNSIHGLEAPDVTGSSLTLGTAGSRRTVYVIDENQKIPDAAAGQQTTHISSNTISDSPTPTVNNTNNVAESQTLTESGQKNDNPSTFLVYNRINTIMGNSSLNSNNNEVHSATTAGNRDDDDHQQDDNKLLRKRSEDNSNSVWYEYGCV
ncbi:protein girdin isoform 1-T1 [Glossina fuscipes fuscipes]